MAGHGFKLRRNSDHEQYGDQTNLSVSVTPMSGIPPSRVKPAIKFPLIPFGVLVAAVVALAMWPYRLIASPTSTLRIVDDSKQPVAGIRVVRSWDTSEKEKGEEEAMSDAKGEVSFERVTFRMSMLRHVSKPLLIFVPSSCASGWEVYSHSVFRIHCPDDYTLKLNGGTWKTEGEIYETKDGVRILTAAYNRRYRHVSWLELDISGRRKDFDYTLTVHRENK
jgi:hypothetical protein